MENTKPRITYEFETQRTNISPKAFYRWVEKEFKRRTGNDLSSWMESFEEWSEPSFPCNCRRDDEICCARAYDWQYWLKGAYNFIMEFQFWDENSGNGYCYAVEFER